LYYTGPGITTAVGGRPAHRLRADQSPFCSHSARFQKFTMFVTM